MLEGHAFIVEAAVSLGGTGLKPGLNVYRFANRIPLLFEVKPCLRVQRVLISVHRDVVWKVCHLCRHRWQLWQPW